jgi:hypothetical protein
MTCPFKTTPAVCAAVAVVLLANPAVRAADASGDLKEQVEQLLKQNAALLETVQQQQGVIEDLNRRVGHIEREATQRSAEESAARDEPGGARGVKLGRVNISGQGGVALFSGQANSMFPNTEFRVDEARLFLEAPIWGDVYFFSELNLATREEDELDLKLGELYLDFEDLSRLWGETRQLNLRVGRLDIPFGEEYLYRDAIDNPLVSHSLPDTWGVDEGLELYGAIGPVSYVVAVQNGGVPGTSDANDDKAVAGRLSYDPTPQLHLSVSGMRTGDLDVEEDELSELWFGGGWFRSIGGPNTTEFHANLVQGDIAWKCARGRLRAFAGYARYDDNDPDADNRRDFYYYAVEGVLDWTRKFYTAARFSQIFVDGGYPMPGQGDLGSYFFNPFAPQAEELWRCSIGVGYRFSPQLVVKTEYSFEGGKEVGGTSREHVDIFAAQAAFGF